MELKPIKGDDRETFDRIISVMKKMNKEDFSGIETRLALSFVAFLIIEGKEDIGFIYYVTEHQTGLLFADLGIIEKHRNKGFAYTALQKTINYINNRSDKFILGEVKDSNDPCIKVMKKLNGIKVSEKHYLLQPDRLDEYIKHIESESIDITIEVPNLQSTMSDVYEDEEKVYSKVKSKY